MPNTLAEIRTVTDVAKYFRTLPGVQEQEEKAARELAAKRADLAAQLERARAQRTGLGPDGKIDPKSDVARLQKEHDAALAAVEKAKAALQVAYERQANAFHAITGQTMACDIEIRKLESDLLETADPRIGDFLEWCYNAIDHVRRAGFVPSSDPMFPKDALTGEPKKQFPTASNGESVAVVVDALRAAINAADALRLTGPIDALAALRAIAATIPTVIEPARVMDRAWLAKVLSDDPDARASWMSRVLAGSGGR